jgi:uncharacterized protein
MISFDEVKRSLNLEKHGIDLALCAVIFDAPMLTEEDSQDTYGEQRLRSLGWLNERVVMLVWTDRINGPHLISCRYGDKYETRCYFKAFV